MEMEARLELGLEVQERGELACTMALASSSALTRAVALYVSAWSMVFLTSCCMLVRCGDVKMAGEVNDWGIHSSAGSVATAPK